MDVILKVHNLICFARYVVDRGIGFLYQKILTLSPSVSIGQRSYFKGLPVIHMTPNTKLVIGNGVSINSSNRYYHTNMHSPVKILLDKPGATVTIGDGTHVNGTCIHAWSSIVIGRGCLIAANTHIMDSNAHDTCFSDPSRRASSKDKAKPIVIEDNVWIGANCFILKGVTIGAGAIVGAGSVVNQDVPCNSIVAGNPAVLIKSFS